MRTVATYHRVPADEQTYTAEDIEVVDFVRERGWDLVAHYTDDVTASRTAFARMLADARLRRFELLVVHRGELLHRSRRDLDATIAELGALGVEVITLQPLAPARAETRGRPPAEFDVDRARAMRRRGMTFAAIARELGVGSATVHRAIGRPKTRRHVSHVDAARIPEREREQLSLL